MLCIKQFYIKLLLNIKIKGRYLITTLLIYDYADVGLLLNKRQQICIDGCSLRCRHTMRKAGI